MLQRGVMPIQILEPTVAAQIAAGEVVERPASIARELIENALDAGARRISVDIRNGGLHDLRVQDDGRGIAAGEVELAFARHATSKLVQADDLWSINTLGFRGEALPSIASVAQIVCITRTAGEELATELRIAGGELQARSAIGAPVGTSISVRNLFYNTPVRREFLRSEASEASAIIATISQYALAYPEVRFSAVLDGRSTIQTSGDNDLRAVLIELYGLDIARQLLPVTRTQGERQGHVQISGYISPPGVTRSSRSGLHLIINRRVIAPRGALAAVVEEAYHTLLLKGRHPLVVLNISVDPAAVDVNIHPTKSEVKFRDAPHVLSVLGRAVREALLASGAPLWEANEPELSRRFELRPAPSQHASGLPMPAFFGEEGYRPQQPGFAEDLRMSSAAGFESPDQESPAWQVLGQVAQRYIAVNTPGGLVVVDQHAAHERILYEQLQAHHHAGTIPSQRLETPITHEFSAEQHTWLITQQTLLGMWGFTIEDFGMAIRVRSLPTILPAERAHATLQAIATNSLERVGWQTMLPGIIACHAAMRAGQVLSQNEMQQLIQDLLCCQHPNTCPHGRPTLLTLAVSQIEQQFERG
jgi:DNA mismatch repair protein MutL